MKMCIALDDPDAQRYYDALAPEIASVPYKKTRSRLSLDGERLLIQVEGDPPERYQLEMQIKSLRMTGGELQPVQSHLVEIALPLA